MSFFPPSSLSLFFIRKFFFSLALPGCHRVPQGGSHVAPTDET